MKKVLFNNYDIEITTREVLFSVIILIFMIITGFFIHEKIASYLDDKRQEYEQAIKINNDQELFDYGMRTGVGNAFVYGHLEAIDTVSLDEIEGKYAAIIKVKEKYTKHQREVTHRDGKRTWTTTEIYYTWDVVKKEKFQCKKIRFLKKEFDSNVIELPEPSYLMTIKNNIFSDVRYKYYVNKDSYNGTIFTELKNNTISKSHLIEKELDEAVQAEIQSTSFLEILFVIAWIILTVFILYLFYILDNRWLED